MSDYLKVNLTKLSYSEAWRWGGWGYVIVITVWKLLGVKRYGPLLVPRTSHIIRVAPSEVTDTQRAAMAPVLSELQHAEFEVAFWYRAETRGSADGIAVAAISQSGDTLGLVVSAASGVKEQVSVGLVSTTVDGQYLSTTNARLSFAPVPEVDIVRLVGKHPKELVERHLQRVNQVNVRQITPTGVEPMLLELQQAIWAENIRRGLYVGVRAVGD